MINSPLESNGPEDKKRVVSFVLMATVWYVWIARNEFIFNSKRTAFFLLGVGKDQSLHVHVDEVSF